MRLVDLVPPVLTRAASRVLRRQRGPRTCRSHDEALRECDGYQDARIVDVVLEKTRRYAERLARGEDPGVVTPAAVHSAMAALSSASADDGLAVLDFGGACGAHYFLARRLAPPGLRIRWVVVETPAMAARAAALAREELSFTDSLDAAVARLGRVDLVHTSGTLQATDDPRAWLRRLVGIGARRMLIARLGLNEGDDDVVTVHRSTLGMNGVGPLPEGFVDAEVRYPFTFLAASAFDAILGERYRRVLTLIDGSGAYDVPGHRISGCGVLAERLGGS